MTSSAGRPTYLSVADQIQDRIRQGHLKPGQPAPSTREITREWGVAMATATKVVAELRSRGVILTRPGVGSVVAGGPSLRPRPAAARPPGRHVSAVDRDRIVAAAVAVADAEGLAAVSLRRVAVELGVATMTLYRGVSGKEDLLLAMMDAVMAEEAWPAPVPSGWRARLDYLARRQWRCYQSHPWLSGIVSLTRPQLAPNAVLHTEWALTALAGYGLDDRTRLHIVLTVFGHVRGAATGLEAEQQAHRDTGLDLEEWMRHNDAPSPR